METQENKTEATETAEEQAQDRGDRLVKASEEALEMAKKPVQVMYHTPQSPTFTVKIGPNRRLQAKDGVIVANEEEAQLLDDLLKKFPDIRANVRKVDMMAAQKAVERFRKSQSPAAVQGPYTSDNGAQGKIREAKQAQKVETLTGSSNPLNKATQVNQPKKMEELNVNPPNVTQPSGGLASRFGLKK